jgi:hypothetical protein
MAIIESPAKVGEAETALNWNQSSAIDDLPFSSFAEFQTAVNNKSFGVGVDSLAAARWSDTSTGLGRRAVVSVLSLLLVTAAIASVVVAFSAENYWLLAALPIQGAAFYLSDSGHQWRKWVTIGGVASLIVFVNLLLNHHSTAAVLTSYAGLTFATVRAAGFMVNSAFRRALIANEELFLIAYENGACKLREKSSGRVYGHRGDRR